MNLSEKALNKKQVHSMRSTFFSFITFTKIDFHFVPNAFEMQKVHAVKSDNTTVLMAGSSLCQIFHT